MLMINMTDKEVNIFKDNDIPFADFLVENDSRFGSDIIIGLKELQAGSGDTSFNVNESGIWLGAKKFVDAPFSVDMHGHVIANSISLSGFVPTGGAAADINNNTTLINGGKIVTGSINASSMVVGSLRQVFTSTPTTPYAVGDLWSAGSSGDLKRCINARTSGSYVSSDWDLASKYTDDSNTTTIIGNTVTTSYLNAKNITAAGVVTGALLQTESGSYAGAKMSSSLGGIVIYGQTLQVRDTSNTLYGSIGGFNGYFNITAVAGRNMLIGADSASVIFQNDAIPLYTNSANLGNSSFRWGNVYTSNIDFASGYYLNKSGSSFQINGFDNLYIASYTFRPVGITFKDGSGVNRYIVVLANDDPV